MNLSPKDISLQEKLLENDKKQYRETNTVLLAFHIILAIPYFIVSPVYMTFVSIFGIIFYLLGFIIINKSQKSLVPYSFMILVEILLHCFCCTLILGWSCGFQYWIFALTCTYLKDYLVPGNSKKYRNHYTRLILSIGSVSYIGIYFISKYVNFPFKNYPSENWASAFMIINALLTFSALGAFTRIYTQQMEFKYSELYNKADFDALTGLGNRYYLNEILVEESQKCNEDKGYSLAMIDIDYFKRVNDTYGHNNGDRVLREVATLLSEGLSKDIEVGRWGGEEFLIVSSCNVKFDNFVQIIEAKRKMISNYKFVLDNNATINCTISAGISTYKNGLEIRDVIKNADDNLYLAKSSGRNKVKSDTTFF